MKLRIPPETLAVLRDGRTVRIRPILPGDMERLREFHDRLSVNTTRLRFFTPMKHLSREFATHLTSVDFVKRCAFVVSPLEEDTIHAVGRYEAESPRSAEVAFVVEDALQGLGIGTLLLERLVKHAREHGYHRLTAVVLCENAQMLSIFRDAPYEPEIHMQGDTAFVRLDIRRNHHAASPPLPQAPVAKSVTI